MPHLSPMWWTIFMPLMWLIILSLMALSMFMLPPSFPVTSANKTSLKTIQWPWSLQDGRD